MKKTATGNFAALLRAHGFRATPARIAILDTLARAKKPLAIDAIMDQQGKGAPDQATVYRALKEMKEVGVVSQIDLGHNHAHYELAELQEHHHLICLRCGKIEDVHRCDVTTTQNIVLRNAKHFAEITRHSLEFYGVCKACKSKDGK